MCLEHGESPQKTDPAKDAQFAAATRARAEPFFKESRPEGVWGLGFRV